MTSSLVKAAPPSEGLKHPQNGAAGRYLEDPPGVGSTPRDGSLGARLGSPRTLRGGARCATLSLAPAVWDAGLRAFGLLHIRPLQSTSCRARCPPEETPPRSRRSWQG